MQLEFSKEELQVQLQLNDLAVKSGGLQVAEAAVILSKKYQEALQDKTAPEIKDKDKK